MQLRALHPVDDRELLHEAYSWRVGPKRNTRVNRMPFEDFAADSPDRVVMGLFIPSFVAVYMFIESAPKTFEAHFSSRRGVDTAIVLAGAHTMVDWFHSQGAVVTAEIVARNRPLRQFVETLGFTLENCACQTVKVESKMTTVKYISSMGFQHRPESTPAEPF